MMRVCYRLMFEIGSDKGFVLSKKKTDYIDCITID